MTNENTRSLPAGSVIQRLLLAAAPGGALTRKPIFLGLAAGLIVLIAAIGFGVHLRNRAADPAAMRFADREIAGLPTRSHITHDAARGQGEVREYGLLDDRHMDATLIMVAPSAGQSGMRDFMQELRDLDPVKNATRATMAATYDMQTRFGSYIAAEIQVDMVGRFKDCIAFLSRFETNSIYIKGWFCDGIGDRPNAERLACALDGLAVDGPLGTQAADAFMREHIARPSFCAAIGRGQDREPRPILPASPSRMR
jgi:hypothetical protein